MLSEMVGQSKNAVKHLQFLLEKRDRGRFIANQPPISLSYYHRNRFILSSICERSFSPVTPASKGNSCLLPFFHISAI